MEHMPFVGWIVVIITIIVIGAVTLRRRVAVEGMKLKIPGVNFEVKNLKIDS